MIIGISGKMQVGKDLTAQMIQVITSSSPLNKDDTAYKRVCGIDTAKINGYHNSLFKIVKFADAIKDIVCILTGCTRDNLEDNEFKESLLPEEWVGYRFINNGQSVFKLHLTYRELLQRIGTDLFRVNLHENTWINALMNKYTAGEHWLISDVRFPNEIAAIKSKDADSKILAIVRDMDYRHDHISETALFDYEFEHTIANNGSKHELFDNVLAWVKINYPDYVTFKE
jgi:hypothetical protein